MLQFEAFFSDKQAGKLTVAASNRQTPGILLQSLVNIIRYDQLAPKRITSETKHKQRQLANLRLVTK